MREEHDPPSGPLRWARKTRYILVLSIISVTSLYGALIPVTSMARTMILLAVSYVSTCGAFLMIIAKVRAKGVRSLKEPPLIASVGFLLPMVVVAVGAFVVGVFLLYLLWQMRDWD